MKVYYAEQLTNGNQVRAHHLYPGDKVQMMEEVKQHGDQAPVYDRLLGDLDRKLAFRGLRKNDLRFFPPQTCCRLVLTMDEAEQLESSDRGIQVMEENE